MSEKPLKVKDLSSEERKRLAEYRAQKQRTPQQTTREQGTFDPGGPVEAFGRWGLQGLSAGTADELAAREQSADNRELVESGSQYGDPRGRVTRGIGGRPLSYGEYADDLRGQYGELKEDNPRAALAGDTAGTLALAGAMPVKSAPPGAPLLERMALARGPGAAMGAMEGVGRADSNDPLITAAGGAAGAALGAAGAMGGEIIGDGVRHGANALFSQPIVQKGLKAATSKAKQLYDEAAPLRLRAAGVRNTRPMKEIARSPGKERAGEIMRETGIGTGKPQFGGQDLGGTRRRLASTVEGHLDDAVAVHEAAGQRLSEIVDYADDAGITVDGAAVAGDFRKLANEAANTAGMEDLAPEILKRADTIERQGAMLFSQAKTQLEGLGTKLAMASEKIGPEQRRRMYGLLRRRMQEAIEAADPDAGAAWAEANEVRSLTHTLVKEGEGFLDKAAQNRQTSASDYGSALTAGGGSVALGADLGTGVAVGMAARRGNQLLRGREHAMDAGRKEAQARLYEKLGSLAGKTIDPPAPQMAAAAESAGITVGTLADRVRALAQADPEQLGPYGHQLAHAAESDPTGQSFAVQHSVLAQSDPDYQARLREIEQQEQEQE